MLIATRDWIVENLNRVSFHHVRGWSDSKQKIPKRENTAYCQGRITIPENVTLGEAVSTVTGNLHVSEVPCVDKTEDDHCQEIVALDVIPSSSFGALH
jgi:hypothetical protein